MVEYSGAYVVPLANYRLMNVDEYPLQPNYYRPQNYYSNVENVPQSPAQDVSVENNNQLPKLKFVDRDEIQQILEAAFFARYPVGSVSSMNLKLIMNKVRKIYNEIPQTLKDKSKYEYSLGVEGNVLTLFVTLRPGKDLFYFFASFTGKF